MVSVVRSRFLNVVCLSSFRVRMEDGGIMADSMGDWSQHHVLGRRICSIVRMGP